MHIFLYLEMLQLFALLDQINKIKKKNDLWRHLMMHLKLRHR